MNRGEPIIVCAAIMIEKFNVESYNDDIILTRPRHWDFTMRIQAYCLGLDRKNKNFKEIEQGFIDQFGKFYAREEALVIARRNNQIRFELDHETKELFSEMLY